MKIHLKRSREMTCIDLGEEILEHSQTYTCQCFVIVPVQLH